VFGTCPECGAKWGDALLSVTQPRTAGPGPSEVFSVSWLGIVPLLVLLLFVFVEFGLLAAAGLALLLIAAGWLYITT
jgi:hypothetical protein